MSDMVAIRSKRILERLARYHVTATILDDYRDFLPDLQLAEVVLGVYENFSDRKEGNLIITNKGIYVLTTKEARYIQYKDISKVQSPEEKETATGCLLTDNSGQPYWLPVVGSHDHFRDVFEFLRFLDRVMSDISSVS